MHSSVTMMTLFRGEEMRPEIGCCQINLSEEEKLPINDSVCCVIRYTLSNPRPSKG